MLRRLSHPHIVEFYGYVKTAEWLYLVMEYVEEGAFSNFLKDFDSLPEHLAAVYTKQILTGLAYLHREGVVHRDLKGYPSPSHLPPPLPTPLLLKSFSACLQGPVGGDYGSVSGY